MTRVSVTEQRLQCRLTNAQEQVYVDRVLDLDSEELAKADNDIPIEM